VKAGDYNEQSADEVRILAMAEPDPRNQRPTTSRLRRGCAGAVRRARLAPLTAARFVAALAVGVSLAQGTGPALGAEERPFDKGSRTRGLVGGWGHSWRPLFGKTRSDLAFGAFHPRMGWFVTDRIELYGEGTLFLYHQPRLDVTAGLAGLSGRYYLADRGAWIPYIHGGAGLLWTSLDVEEIDRVFNFQLIAGIGWRQNRPRGPRLVFELRNHHISNAGTAGENLGINAVMFLSGVEWVLRP
jgi:lipid A 3-O-deacylase